VIGIDTIDEALKYTLIKPDVIQKDFETPKIEILAASGLKSEVLVR